MEISCYSTRLHRIRDGGGAEFEMFSNFKKWPKEHVQLRYGEHKSPVFLE